MFVMFFWLGWSDVLKEPLGDFVVVFPEVLDVLSKR